MIAKLPVAAKTTIGGQLAMFGHPACQCGRQNLVTMLCLQLLCSDGKGIAEIVKSDAVEDHAQRICFIAQ